MPGGRDSQATVGNAVFRTLLGLCWRMSSNAFQEFWPDVRHRLPGQDGNAKVFPTAEKPAHLEFAAGPLNIFQRAIKSRPLIGFQGGMASAPRWN